MDSLFHGYLSIRGHNYINAGIKKYLVVMYLSMQDQSNFFFFFVREEERELNKSQPAFYASLSRMQLERATLPEKAHYIIVNSHDHDQC